MELETIPKPVDDVMSSVAGQGEMARVQAQVISAKRFPRDTVAAYQRVIAACKRPGVARSATYAFPRGGSVVKGPSIRLAEELARSWGNIDCGVKELSQQDGYSTVEAYCLDLETNYRSSMTFTVSHRRGTKSGDQFLTDPRDIYEHVANSAARRKRACILAVVPSDLTEDAVAACEATLAGDSSEPIDVRVNRMLAQFKGLPAPVSRSMLETKLGHTVEDITLDELNELGAVFRSLKDAMTKREDWFKVTAVSDESANQKLKTRKKKKETALIEVETSGGGTVANLTGAQLVVAKILALEEDLEELHRYFGDNQDAWVEEFSADDLKEITDTYYGLAKVKRM